MIKKKFSIGLSTEISLEEYEEILASFHKNIDYVYFSVPISRKFQSRANIYSNFTFDEATVFLIKAIRLFKTYNIKIELALNTYRLEIKDIEDAYLYCKNTLKIMPDAIVSNSKYIDTIIEIFPKVYNILSFNEAIRAESDLKRVSKFYDEIVIGSSAIRNFDLWKYINLKGFKCRLLLNNGCSFNCGSCNNAANCGLIFEKNLKEKDINYLYALQSLYPSELKKYIASNPYIYGYKISNRNCSAKYLHRCLEGYINGCNWENDGLYHYYWARLKWFSKYKAKLNKEKIDNYKKDIWKQNDSIRKSSCSCQVDK